MITYSKARPVRDYDANWLREENHLSDQPIDNAFLTDPTKRKALLFDMGYVASRCPTNKDFATQNSQMLNLVLGHDLETRIFLLDEGGPEPSLKSIDSQHYVKEMRIVDAIIGMNNLSSSTENLIEPNDHPGWSEYMFTLIGKRSVRDDIKYPENSNVVIGALYVATREPLTESQKALLTDYAWNVAPKVHLKYQRKFMEDLNSLQKAMFDETSHNLASPVKATIAKLWLIDHGTYGPVPDPLSIPLKNAICYLKNLETRMDYYLRSARSGKICFQPRLTDLKRDIVDLLLERYASNLQARGQHVDERTETSFSEGTVMLSCDPIWLHEAYQNLIKNIIDHAPDNCRITIGYRQDENYHILNVWNSGPHIDLAELNVDGKPHVKQNGQIGYHLGLTSVKRIAEQHGGRFEIRNTGDPNIDPGNDMIIYIPKELPVATTELCNKHQ
jgi:hypothetical protein